MSNASIPIIYISCWNCVAYYFCFLIDGQNSIQLALFMLHIFCMPKITWWSTSYKNAQYIKQQLVPVLEFDWPIGASRVPVQQHWDLSLYHASSFCFRFPEQTVSIFQSVCVLMHYVENIKWWFLQVTSFYNSSRWWQVIAFWVNEWLTHLLSSKILIHLATKHVAVCINESSNYSLSWLLVLV